MRRTQPGAGRLLHRMPDVMRFGCRLAALIIVDERVDRFDDAMPSWHGLAKAKLIRRGRSVGVTPPAVPATPRWPLSMQEIAIAVLRKPLGKLYGDLAVPKRTAWHAAHRSEDVR